MNVVATPNELTPVSPAVPSQTNKSGPWLKSVPVAPEIPAYLHDTYYWAYISPRNVPLLDRDIVVRTILWQQHRRLQEIAFEEIEAGQSVLQPASVYGDFAANHFERPCVTL